MRKLIWIIVIVAVAAGVYWFYSAEPAETGKANPFERTEKVERGDLLVTVSAVGTIEPRQAVDVKSKASGQIIKIEVDDGDLVKQGQLICVLDKTTALNDYRQAEADFNVAEVTLRQADKELKRQKELFDGNLISESTYDDALLQRELAKSQRIRAEATLSSAKERLDDTIIKSPLNGVILKRYVDDGQIISSGISNVSGGTSIVRVAVMDTVYVEVDVDETDIGKVEVGQSCTVEADAFPGRKFIGEIIKISPLGEVEQNVTYFKVTTAVDNTAQVLKAGMNATCEITCAEARDVLIVPREAVGEDKPSRGGNGRGGHGGARAGRPAGGQHGGQGKQPGQMKAPKFVYVIENGEPVPRQVETGVSNYENTEILSGLSEGEEILVRARSMVMADREKFRERMRRWNALPGVKKQDGK